MLKQEEGSEWGDRLCGTRQRGVHTHMLGDKWLREMGQININIWREI